VDASGWQPASGSLDEAVIDRQACMTDQHLYLGAAAVVGTDGNPGTASADLIFTVTAPPR
jgi:hypothetical protein